MHPLIKSIASIQEAISELETQKEYGSVTKEEAELLNVLKASYHMLTRTTLLSILMEAEGMPVPKPSKPDTTEEFIYRLVTGKGEISFRDLFIDLLRKRQQISNEFTQKKIGTAVEINPETISNYVTNKRAMSTANLEKIINYILLTGDPLE